MNIPVISPSLASDPIHISLPPVCLSVVVGSSGGAGGGGGGGCTEVDINGIVVLGGGQRRLERTVLRVAEGNKGLADNLRADCSNNHSAVGRKFYSSRKRGFQIKMLETGIVCAARLVGGRSCTAPVGCPKASRPRLQVQ